MVTEYDRASEALIVDGLLAARPDDAIVGEEGANRPGTSGVAVARSTRSTAPRTSSTACPATPCRSPPATATASLAGVVHVPALGETFHAGRGGGAFLDDRAHPLLGRPTVLATALVATGFSYDPGAARAPGQRAGRR